MVKISIIMACYNAERFIREAIESVLCQTYKNIELIIVDDVSTDSSLSIARKASSLDSRIFVYALEKNIGPGGARNFGIAKSTGKWLAVLDADDVFLEDKLQKQMDFLQKSNADIVLIGSNSFQIDVHSTIISEHKYPVTTEKLKMNLVLGKKFPAHSSIMYRADIVKLSGAFNNRFSPSEGGGEDWDLWLNLIDQGDFAIVPEPLVKYRNHEFNISRITPEREKYGYAAIICYWLRTWGYADPSKYSRNEDWLEFLNWVTDRLREEGIFNYYHSIRLWRNQINKKAALPSKCIEAARIIIMNPLDSWQFLKSKLFQDVLPKKLAREWIKKSSVASQN